jgi:Bacterial extracellular solute-binding protein
MRSKGSRVDPAPLRTGRIDPPARECLGDSQGSEYPIHRPRTSGGGAHAGPDAISPSGLMRQKIEVGADVDLFASADMAQARRLAIGHPERFVVNFTRNRLCGVARGALGLTPGEHAGSLADLTVRLATSTPGADPAGDYAWAVFARAESMRPGARAALEAKAQRVCEQRAGEFLRALLSRSKTLLVCN